MNPAGGIPSHVEQDALASRASRDAPLDRSEDDGVAQRHVAPFLGAHDRRCQEPALLARLPQAPLTAFPLPPETAPEDGREGVPADGHAAAVTGHPAGHGSAPQ